MPAPEANALAIWGCERLGVTWSKQGNCTVDASQYLADATLGEVTITLPADLAAPFLKVTVAEAE